ncbi:MAG: DedA family protein [Desulforhopalus sp.]|nr:DedA family protein [Desulforhopalus sp.]
MDLLSTITGAPGLPALFLLSFLASTVLPIGSEWLLVLLIVEGTSPAPVVLTASIGNFLGAYTTYLIGFYGVDFVMGKVLRISDKQLARPKEIYGRYGIWSLLLSWLPVIGDPLCLLAGLFKTRFGHFALLVFVGKFSRYAAVAWLTLAGAGE